MDNLGRKGHSQFGSPRRFEVGEQLSLTAFRVRADDDEWFQGPEEATVRVMNVEESTRVPGFFFYKIERI